MPPTLEAICTSNALQRRINDVRFLTTLSGGAASEDAPRRPQQDRAPSARLVAPRAQAAPPSAGPIPNSVKRAAGSAARLGRGQS